MRLNMTTIELLRWTIRLAGAGNRCLEKKYESMKVEFSLGAWSDMRTALGNNQVDVLQGMSSSEERTVEVEEDRPIRADSQSLARCAGTA